MVCSILNSPDIGLLIDSERIYTETTIEILKKYGKEPVFPMSVKSSMMGRPGPQAYGAHACSLTTGQRYS